MLYFEDAVENLKNALNTPLFGISFKIDENEVRSLFIRK